MLALKLDRRPDDLPAVWTRAIVREWLRDAATALRWLPDGERRWLADKRAWMPEVLRASADVFANAVDREATGDKERPRIRHTATPEQIDRLYRVIEWGWIGWLDAKREVKLVWARACGFAPRRIRSITGLEPRQQRYREAQAVERIAARMNRLG